MKWQMKCKLNLFKNQGGKEIITVKYIDNKYFKEKNPQMSIEDVPLITNRRCLVSANFCAGGDGWQKASRGKVLSLGFLLVIKRGSFHRDVHNWLLWCQRITEQLSLEGATWNHLVQLVQAGSHCPESYPGLIIFRNGTPQPLWASVSFFQIT